MHEKVKLEDVDAWASFFPKPIAALMRVFHQECRAALRMMVMKLGLVAREDYEAQQMLLKKAYARIEALEAKLKSDCD